MLHRATMRTMGVLLALGWGAACVQAQPVLYESDAFTVTPSSVRQGAYEAVAVSPTEIRSTYKEGFGHGMRRVVHFKFSINGLDNERPPGADHRVWLDPTGGRFVTPVYTFGQPDPAEAALPDGAPLFLGQNQTFDAVFRADARPVLDAFEEQGYYATYNGVRIQADDFEGFYLAGSADPLSWDWTNLARDDRFQLQDPDGDGIFELTVRFQVDAYREVDDAGTATWRLQEDVSAFPQYESPQPLVDALYTLSLEEALQDVRDDGAFMAGAKWPGVWTRDISYSILLAFAAILPEASKRSLMAKVRDGVIIQDTGTGGSWPVSSDRMTWALAAWEVYAVTGDDDWLRTAFAIIKKSAEADLDVVRDPATGLFYGESSFLDWREQTYPLWMDPKDIYRSQTLGTNAVHYETYRILGRMADRLGEPSAPYYGVAASIRDGMNAHLWMADRGYYGQYRYGRTHLALSPRAEALGEALAVLFGIAGETQQTRIVRRAPVVPFGTPSIYPQIPGIPPYHNDGIWPFVEAYWTWAAAQAGNGGAVEHGLAGIYRAAALFLTNKENMVATTGDFEGTVINSNRQLWSVAGNLATVYRVFFGMRFYPDRLAFRPFVPRAYAGVRTLRNVRYRGATLTVTLRGYGDAVASVTLDGELLENAVVPGDLEGAHTLVITLNDEMSSSAFNLVENRYAPETPVAALDGDTLRWDAVDGATVYQVYRNGVLHAATNTPALAVPPEDGLAEYQALAMDANGLASFLSEPVRVTPDGATLIVQPDRDLQTTTAGYTGPGYLLLTQARLTLAAFTVEVERPGAYSVDFRYANGHGPINTDNKAAIRTLKLAGRPVGPVVLPQRGVEAWEDWGYSNALTVELPAGRHVFEVVFLPENQNMNGSFNAALLDHLRLTRLAVR